MASSVTLAQLRLDARLYADQRPGSTTSFISEIELTRLINLKARELYDLLVGARGSAYYATESTLSVVANTSRYNLPATFYELISVTLEWNDRDHELLFPVASTRLKSAFEANWIRWSRYDRKAYQLRAQQIEFLPMPASAVTCRLQFVPAYTDLAADGDTFDGINGWEKMLVVGVAIEMLAIDKRTNATLQAIYDEQLERIETLKNERDAEAPKEIIDEQALRGRRGWFGRVIDDTGL